MKFNIIDAAVAVLVVVVIVLTAINFFAAPPFEVIDSTIQEIPSAPSAPPAYPAPDATPI